MRGGPPQPLDEALAAAGVIERAREIHGAPEAPVASPSAPPASDVGEGPFRVEPGDRSGSSSSVQKAPLERPTSAESPPTVRECSSCHARIYWAQVVDEHGERTGKPMPVDEQPDPVRGNVVLYRTSKTARAVFARVLRKGEPPPPGAHLRTSHFATCPNAQHHRRTRR